MHYGAVIKVMGRLMGVEAVMLLAPLAVSVCNAEPGAAGFAIASGASALLWCVAEAFTRHTPLRIGLREGFILTALTWVIFSLTGLIPFMMCSHALGFTDALFETISGFTTTGASVFADTGELGKGVLLWRAETQWIGGLGIIFFMLAVLPALNGREGISMFHAEATGIFHTRLHPRIRQSAVALWGVYSALTVACILLLWAGPMSFFDALCQTFAAISTGGFTTHAAGLAYWNSDYVDVVLTIFMIIGGLNFMLLYSAVAAGRWKELTGNAVARCYLCIILCAWALQSLAVYMNGQGHTLRQQLLMPLTHTVSAITSSGFTVENAEYWGPGALTVTMLIMIAGSCAGSTAGGVKIDRLMAIWSNMCNNLRRTVFTHRTYIVRIGRDPLDEATVRRIQAFLTLYFGLILLTTLAATFLGYDFTDSLFMSVSAVGCNGLGYGITGAEGGYAALHPGLKYLLMADMLAGRLELFAFVTLLLPSFWRK